MADKKTKAAPPHPETFRLKLPAESENLDIIRRFIAGIAANMGFSDEDVYQTELAVDEASANVVKHAYVQNEGDEEQIIVTVRRKSDRIVITIADRGKGFDPNQIEAPDMDRYLREMRKGGLGVHLIKTIMDEVDFRMQPGVRNEVKMTKFLAR